MDVTRGVGDTGAMTRRLLFAVLAAASVATACSGSSSTPSAAPPASSPSAAASSTSTAPDAAPLKAAVRAYSSAFLSGNGAAAWALLSDRCKARGDRAQFEAGADQAADLYGDQPIRSLTIVDLEGDLARVTYTFDDASLTQTREPWVRERGEWHEDDC